LETIRTAGALLSAASILGGYACFWLLRHPRTTLACVAAVPIVVGAALSRPAAQLTVYRAVQTAAKQHWGHVATAGYAYKLLDDRFYPDKGEIDDIGFGEAARFVVRAFVRYATVPLPWEAESRAALAYIPEQMFWYLLIALAPIGLVFSLRRD